MSEFLSTIWTQVVSNTWVYVYSVFACIMIRWAWYLRDQSKALPETGFFDDAYPFGPQIVEEALPDQQSRNFEKADDQGEGNSSASV
jgi:hypothetical protein